MGSEPHSRRNSQFNLMKYRGSRFLVGSLILAAFGPYVLGPIRTEQLAGYGIAFLVLFTFVRLKSWTVGLLAPWLWVIGIATVSTFFSYTGTLPWGRGDGLSGYDNLLLPLAIMFGIWSIVPCGGAGMALRAAAKMVVWAATINAVLAVASSLIPTVAVPLLRPFWSASSGNVAENAIQMGRYTGIFNQPAEAGVAYAIAAILAVWAYSHRPAFMYGLVTLITVGGMLSVSKVFLLIGLPVTLGLLWVTRRGTSRVWMVVTVFSLGLLLLSSTFIQDWAGYEYMMRLLEVPPGQSAVQFYTAGRWNEESSMLTVIGFILSVSPLVGVGVAGLRVPYDSQWTETIVMSGVLGAIGVIAVLVILFIRFRKIQDWSTRCTALAFWLVLSVGSFGISTLTANRVTTIVWVVVALFVAIAARDEGTRSRDLAERAETLRDAPSASIGDQNHPG